jgi:hypothetical protein
MPLKLNWQIPDAKDKFKIWLLQFTQSESLMDLSCK